MITIITVEKAETVIQRETLDIEAVLSNNRRYYAFRRVQDVCFSLFTLMVLSLPMLIVALVIWLDDPNGSPIFTQVRVGQNGKEFRLYKFRSMYQNAEKQFESLLDKNEMDGPVFKIKKDPRITRVGRFIRRTSIDELPQFVNVLKGDMSIVGPRPALPREVVQYDDYQRQRLLVKPGLTCFWQIQPNRNDMHFDEWVALDVKYIKQRSFMTDWSIIFKTVGAVIYAQGE